MNDKVSAGRTGLLAGLMMMTVPAWAETDWSKIEVTASRVAGSVWMLEGGGGNIGVSAGADGILIVDDQFAPLAPKIRAALKGIQDGKLEFVLNTHFHGDHTGGNSEFGGEAPILAHSNVRKRLAAGNKTHGRETPPAVKPALPVVTFDQSLSIHFNGEEIRVLHLPKGHTDGDSVIFFTGSNVVHMGDHFFNGRFPFVDLDSGGTLEGYINNVRDVLGKLPPGARIIPGHGALATAADLQSYLGMLEKTTAIVRDGMKAGTSLDNLKKAGLPAEWKEWGGGFIDTPTWIATVYRALGGKVD